METSRRDFTGLAEAQAERADCPDWSELITQNVVPLVPHIAHGQKQFWRDLALNENM